VQSDALLVNAVLNGDREAFAILVKRYERVVRAIALEVRCDMDFAADVSQQTFLVALEKLSTLRKPAAFGAWIMKVTRRCALEWAQKRIDPACRLNQASLHDVPHNGSLDIDKQRLLALILRLPVSEKQVVMLRYFEGHKVREVAEITGRGVGTVTKQLSRAHKRLKVLLGESRYE